MATVFQKLNDGWNAEPNAPQESVSVAGATVQLEFFLNYQRFPSVDEEDRGRLTFSGCSKWRLGATNDEGWYRGQCRFSRLAPAWGELYEVSGELLDERVAGWRRIDGAADAPQRRFLFYLRDSTFEVDAQDWRFEVLPAGLGKGA